MSLIERLKLGSELKSTVSIGKLFQRFMTRSAKKLYLTELLQKYLKNLIRVASSRAGSYCEKVISIDKGKPK